MTDWRAWTYDEWNKRLVDYCFRVTLGGRRDALERIPATPEELRLVTGDSNADPKEVIVAFASRVKEQIPVTVTTFCSFCLNYRGWSSSSSDIPHFFAMLWLTCLVAYGYPEGQETNSFHDRMTALFGRAQHFDCLPQLWADLAEWSRNASQATKSSRFRELILPPEDSYRSNIGHSWFLAFPHHQDRRKLRELLTENDLIGEEPAVLAVIEVLKRHEQEFSRFFGQDLSRFIEAYIERGSDARKNAFWRAVRQEALADYEVPSYKEARSAHFGILATFDDDGLMAYVASASGMPMPPGYSKMRLPEDLEFMGFVDLLVLNGEWSELEGIERAMENVLTGKLKIPKVDRYVRRGVLVFQEELNNEYRLVGGSEAHEARIALVSDERVKAFRDAYGGEVRRSRFPGWYEVIECKVRICRDLPHGLEGVLHLQETMFPPSIRFVGGIRTIEGFFAFTGFLPTVRFAGAQQVDLLDEAGNVVARAMRDDVSPDDWRLPDVLAHGEARRFVVRVTWSTVAGNLRTSEASLSLIKRQLGQSFKPLGSGRYLVEGVVPGEAEAMGYEEVPLGIAQRPVVDSDSLDARPDLLECEPDVLYLGPGLGDVSRTPRDGFDWLVKGPKGRPDLLLFIGNTSTPTERANTKCDDSGTRSRWRTAFHKGRAAVRQPDGSFRPVSDFPVVLQSLKKYRDLNLDRSEDILTVECPSGIGREFSSWLGTAPDKRVDNLVDALGALSVRNSGIPYPTMWELFVRLVDSGSVPSPGFIHDLMRAWIESGAIDITYAQGRPSTRFVARRPRFIAYRVGDRLRATLLGLAPTVLRHSVRRLAKAWRCPLTVINPSCRWVPELLRIECEDTGQLLAVSAELGLEPPMWLDWSPNGDEAGNLEFRAREQRLHEGEPDVGFIVEKKWDWSRGRFLPVTALDRFGKRIDEDVIVELRRHRERHPIYVVTRNGKTLVWTFIRNWALLYAYEVKFGTVPFGIPPGGPPSRDGTAGVYLPLPVGRLCAVLGLASAGPTVGTEPETTQYRYPFPPSYSQKLLKTVLM